MHMRNEQREYVLFVPLELAQVEEVIEGLRNRRQLVIASIERLRGNLASMVGEAQHTGEYLALDEDEQGTAVIAEVEAETEEADQAGDGELEDRDLEDGEPPSGRFRYVNRFDDETEEQAIRTEDL